MIADKTFGQRLKELRIQLGFSQSDVVKMTGLSSGIISQLESGHHRPTYSSITSLMSGLGISAGELMGEVNPGLYQGMGLIRKAIDMNTKSLHKEIEDLRAKLKIAEDALGKVVDPRKVGHGEPDAYTRLGCLANIANEALKTIRGEK